MELIYKIDSSVLFVANFSYAKHKTRKKYSARINKQSGMTVNLHSTFKPSVLNFQHYTTNDLNKSIVDLNKSFNNRVMVHVFIILRLSQSMQSNGSVNGLVVFL